MQTYCSPAGKYTAEQGQLPPDFWRNVEFQSGGPIGARYVQRELTFPSATLPGAPMAHPDHRFPVTGCIRPEIVSQLNPGDAGGQYDSNGGVGGMGNPQGSVCLGFNHYVELVEPRGPRACIKCCENPNDCPVDKDTLGCPTVIPGNYFDCLINQQ